MSEEAKETGRLVFSMDVETALEFYKRARKRGAKTEKERTEILIELANEGKMKSVVSTNRTEEQIAKDMAKNFNYKVLHLKKKEK